MANYSLSFSGTEVDQLLTKVSVASGTLLTTESTIQTSQIANSAITSDKLANNSIATAKLANGSVNGAKIAQGTSILVAVASATQSMYMGGNLVATQAWVNVAIGSAILSAINSSY